MTMPAAASETAPAYLVVIGKGWDREKMGAYARSLPPVYAAANGRYLAIGGPGRGVEWVAAPAHFRDRSLVLARFDSPAAVQAFWWGEGYRDAMKNRYAAGAFTVVTLAGTADDAAAKAGPEAGFLYEAHVVADEAAYAEYARARAAALAAYGGRLLVDVEPGNFVALGATRSTIASRWCTFRPVRNAMRFSRRLRRRNSRSCATGRGSHSSRARTGRRRRPRR